MKKNWYFSIMLSLFVFSQTVFSQTVTEVADKAREVADKLRENEEAADTTRKGPWILEGRFQLSLNQAYSSNWIGSSDPFVGLSTLDNLSLFYRKNKMSWENILDIDFGMRYTFNAKSGKQMKYEKTSDKIDLNSQLGFQMKKNWYYGGLLQINTQLANGWNPENDTIKTSSFMTPGYLTLSLGISYKRQKWSWYISPVAAKLTTKTDPTFYEQAAFGVEERKKHYLSVGAFTRVHFNADIHPKINLNTKLELFYDYLGEYEQMRNTTANFEMTWRFSVTEWLSITFRTALLYDYSIRFPVYTKDGEVIEEMTTDHLQFQETFGLTLGYKFKIPKKNSEK